MGRFVQNAAVQTKATVVLNETELAALDALTGYGIDQFLEVFYHKMGKVYLQPHEQGLRSFFEAVRSEVPALLAKAKLAREAFQEKT